MKDDDTRERTQVVSPPTRSDASTGWAIYRVRTNNSTYTLAVKTSGPRPCAILTNYRFAASSDDIREGQDTAPLSGDVPLFSLPYGQWIGRPLHVGTVSTSAVRGIDPETDPSVVEEVTGTGRSPHARPAPAAAPSAPPSRPSAPPSPPLPPLPEEEVFVRVAEATSRNLHFLFAGSTQQLPAVRAQAALDRRLQTALEECRLMLHALHGRVGR